MAENQEEQQKLLDRIVRRSSVEGPTTFTQQELIAIVQMMGEAAAEYRAVTERLYALQTVATSAFLELADGDPTGELMLPHFEEEDLIPDFSIEYTDEGFKVNLSINQEMVVDGEVEVPEVRDDD